MTNASVRDKSPIELVHALIRDSIAHVYREEFERRIGKRRIDITLDDVTSLLSNHQETLDYDEPSHGSCLMFHPNGSFRPFSREDFSDPGAWVIADAILSTGWEGCYTKTETPDGTLGALKRVRDKKLTYQDDFDSPAHANLFRVIVGEFNKWGNKNLSR